MQITPDHIDRSDEIIALFAATFTDSEGADEGQLIGRLVRDVFGTARGADIFVFSALEDERVVGSIVFTRLSYAQDPRTVFVLAPVAVATAHQSRGIGQALLRHGLDRLRAQGVDVVLTYGDPRYYGKVGFGQITQDQAQPPMPLQYPEGWLGQSLTDRPFEPLIGPSTCVDALNKPEYW